MSELLDRVRKLMETAPDRWDHYLSRDLLAVLEEQERRIMAVEERLRMSGRVVVERAPTGAVGMTSTQPYPTSGPVGASIPPTKPEHGLRWIVDKWLDGNVDVSEDARALLPFTRQGERSSALLNLILSFDPNRTKPGASADPPPPIGPEPPKPG